MNNQGPFQTNDQFFTGAPHISQDGQLASNIKTIGILHIVLASLQGLIVLIFFAIFVIIMVDFIDRGRIRGRDEEMFLVSLIVLVIGLPQFILTLIGGIRLVKLKSGGIATVMSCFMLLSFFPLGTALGIATLVTITKPEAKAIFNSWAMRQQSYGPPPTQQPPGFPPMR